MKRNFLVAIAASTCLPVMALAQGAPDPRLGPSTPVQVTNTDPIKVTVVLPQQPAQVLCSLRSTTSSGTTLGNVTHVAGSVSTTTLSCPVGLKGVLARRVVLDLALGLNPQNILNAMAVWGFSKEENPGGIPELEDMNLIAGLSYSAPEKVLDVPIPVTKDRPNRKRITCSSIPGAALTCSAGLLLIGDPIPQ